MTRLSLIEREPTLGRSLAELAQARQYRDFFPLDDAADLDRVPFFHPAQPEPGIGPLGRGMLEPAFRRYRHDALIACAFADVHVLGADGVVVLDSGVVRDTLDHLAPWHADSNVEQVRGRDHLRLRRPMQVGSVVAEGRHLIGFNGGWRDHGHWLAQCLPRLHAFTLLRRRWPDLKLVLPPLAEGSVQRRTLDLLGIPPDAVHTLPADAATCFAAAILAPAFDIWSVSAFAAGAADAVVAGLPPPAPGAPPRPDKVYLHRAAGPGAVANFAALAPLLQRYGFAVVDTGTMDLAEQVATMQAARHVIGEHGAGTAGILFCRPATRVLELFGPFAVQPAAWSIASRRGLDYGYLVGRHAPTGREPDATWQSACEMPPDRLEEAIRATLRLPPRAAAAAAPAAAPAPVAAPAAPAPGHAAPAAAPARETPAAAFAGTVEPIFEVVNTPARLGHAGSHERLPMFAPAVPPAQRPMHDEARMPPDFVAEHYSYPAPATVAAYAVGGGVLWSTGFVTLGQHYIALPDCLPAYFRPHFASGAEAMHPIFAGAIGRDDVRTITLDRPVAVATHPNLTYGHFLLEALPRLWLLSVLHEFGADIPLALSRNVADWAKGFTRLLHADRDTVWYDGATERVQAPAIVLPAMLHTQYNFHPALNLMVRDLLRRLPPPDPRLPKLVYLAQANFGDEKLENAAEAEQAMRGLGFAIVRLGELTPEQQILLFAAARVVVAEHGDALYGALFAPPGTRVVAINFANHYQSAIARLRRHRIAYVPPADGQLRHWRLTRGLSRTWQVDIGQLVGTVREMMQGVAPSAPG